MAEENKELIELINELVSKAGPTAGQIKLNQDPDKVARLIELGWKPKRAEGMSRTPIEKIELRLGKLEVAQKKTEEALTKQIKRIDICSIRR